jgi:hypothetical protein
MRQDRSELLDLAIARLAGLPPEEQDRVAIEILADVYPEEEWALLVTSEAYGKWLTKQPESQTGLAHAGPGAGEASRSVAAPRCCGGSAAAGAILGGAGGR